MSNQTDEARWREAGMLKPMTLEQRAEYIAGGCGPSTRIGGTVWSRLRDRALSQLREVEALARGETP